MKPLLTSLACVGVCLFASLAAHATEDRLEAVTEAMVRLEARAFELRERLANATDEERRDALRLWNEQTAARRELLNRAVQQLTPPPAEEGPIIVEIPSTASAKERSLITAQVALDNERDEVAARHADPEQRRDALRAWSERNAARFLAQAELGRELQAAHSAQNPPRKPTAPQIPADASPRLRTLMLNEAALAAEEQALRERFAPAGPEVQRDQLRHFHEQTAVRREALEREAEALFAP